MSKNLTFLKTTYLTAYDTLIGQYKGLPKSIYILFITRIINRFGDFVYPILTFLMIDELGYSKSKTGLLIAIMGVFSIFGSLIGGFLADYIGRKKILVISHIIAASVYIICGFLKVSNFMIYMIFVSQFFLSISRPVSSSMVTDLAPKKERKRTYSLLYLGINLGVAFGLAISGYLYKYNLISVAFIGDGITTLISILLVILYVPETKPTEEIIEASLNSSENNLEKADKQRIIKALLKRPALLQFILLGFVCSFIYSQHEFTIPLQLNSIYGSKEGARVFGLMMSFNAVVVICITSISNKLTHKKVAAHNLALACLFYCIGFGMLSYMTGKIYLFISALFWTIGEILSVTNQGVYIANHTPINQRGRFNSIINIIMGSGHTLAPMISGQFLKWMSFTSFWIFIGILAIIVAFSFYQLGLKDIKNIKKVNSCQSA